MASGRLPGDFWPRCHGWAPPGAASEESEVDEKSDQSSQAADLENEEGHGDLTAAMKRPSSKKKPTPKSEAKRKPRLKRPASALAMTEPEDSSPSMPSKLTKPRKKPSGTVRPAKKKQPRSLTTSTSPKDAANADGNRDANHATGEDVTNLVMPLARMILARASMVMMMSMKKIFRERLELQFGKFIVIVG